MFGKSFPFYNSVAGFYPRGNCCPYDLLTSCCWATMPLALCPEIMPAFCAFPC
ncbi:uncharacterized protein BO97DRAFT_407948 [Aspergillus homomorphus CBS 101889]|uniref:Uncharacterized protein n=1 Tax=Aspergillus homomorphus (strain CBS 101889) TaxID=1450537 RepID=A0A395HS26_ASPHC|nr:hypothetical protein BO97DRAFT_407948 [Aspergillus homomorphus CBS 101889]RAL09054.1 hypothetical protein BO97DRAFT_407948 [Aspergillus homomorphus CBS 101889]